MRWFALALAVVVVAVAVLVALRERPRPLSEEGPRTVGEEESSPHTKPPPPTVPGLRTPAPLQQAALPGSLDEALRLNPKLAEKLKGRPDSRTLFDIQLRQLRLLETCGGGRIKSKGEVYGLETWKRIDRTTWELVAFKADAAPLKGPPLPADEQQIVKDCVDRLFIGWRRPYEGDGNDEQLGEDGSISFGTVFDFPIETNDEYKLARGEPVE